MQLESPKVTVAKSAAYVFNALTDVKNFEKLMPDTIAKFEVTDENTFLFGLSGMPEIKLRLKEQTPNTYIKLGAASDKIPFTLIANIENTGGESALVQLHFEGEFNPMMAMMVKGPISKFLDTLASNLDKL
ncbi:SRPBCC family protein [Flavobacterium sp.]|uniref:SRPBCC family protein n=1 Tax=Flavobacterium sp. TaxID=239 RepID=UPI002628A6B3|nr:SRPBCC family protein [Flavobacterium sp.]